MKKVFAIIYPTLFIIISIVISYNYRQRVIESVIDLSSSDVIKTVAHIDLSEHTNLELMYKDVDTDVAYYRVLKPEALVREGDFVFNRDGVRAKVIGLDVTGFYLDNSDEFYPGLSGTAIFNTDDKCVGYVSQIINKDRVYCIWR